MSSAEQRTLCGAEFWLKGLGGHDGSTGVASCVLPTNQSDSVATQKWCAQKERRVKLCARVPVVFLNLCKKKGGRKSLKRIKRRKQGI
jgi:hypothetical protein